MRVALTYNIKPEDGADSPHGDYYAEWDDGKTIDAVASALEGKHTVIRIEADERIVEKLKSGAPEIVFNIAEGIDSPSRESQVPVICEMLGIPYTGSDAFTLAASLNKARAKEILFFHGVPTPGFQVLTSPGQQTNGLRFPVIVKPLREGSSMGIRNDSIALSREALTPKVERILEEYRQPALVETFLPGREFTAALLGNGDDLRVLPLVEIDFSSLPAEANPVYSYEAKWVWDRPDKPLRIFTCPAKLDRVLEEKIKIVCRRAFLVLGCRDWCRVDVRLDDRMNPHIIELNPLPGILPDPEENSCFPKAARAAGMSYEEIILGVLEAARARYGPRAWEYN